MITRILSKTEMGTFWVVDTSSGHGVVREAIVTEEEQKELGWGQD